MPVFTYLARDDSGKPVEGEVTAASEMDAARALRSEGKFIVRVEPKGARKAGGAKVRGDVPVQAARRKSSGFGEKFRADDVIFFTNQLAVMVDTGVSLTEALEACRHEGNSPRFARALDAVIEQVKGGSEFSAALSEHPKVFSTLYVSLIRASEASGQLAPILTRLADHIERQRDMTKKIKGAVTYPIVMCVFAIGVSVFMVSFVLPKFAQIYAGREESLPVLTKWLLALSDYVTTFGPYALGVMLVGVAGLIWYLRSPAGRWKADGLKLWLPLVGPLFHRSCLARSLRTLGTMIQSGVSMLESIQLTTRVSGNLHYQRLWKEANERIERGQQVSEALADHREIPRAVLKMLAAGERSGRLGPVMERVALFCESELNAAVKTLTSLIEPAIIVFLGVVIGGLVMALLLPIFTISKVM